MSGTLLGEQGRSSGLLRRDGRAGRCAGQPLPANSAREMASSDEDHRRTHQHRKRSAYDTSRQLSPCHLLHHDNSAPEVIATLSRWFLVSPGLSDRAIAEGIGVGNKTVSRARKTNCVK